MDTSERYIVKELATVFFVFSVRGIVVVDLVGLLMSKRLVDC